MRKIWASRAEDRRNVQSYEKKMHDAFMAHLGKRYEEMLLEEDAKNADMHAPKSLDDWFLKFCKEKWGTEDIVLRRNEEGEIKNLKIVGKEGAKGMEDGQNQENDEEYLSLLMYAERMRIQLKRQQEKQRRVRKVAIFAAFFLGAVVLVTSTAKAFGINPWKLLIKDEGTNEIISQAGLGEEKNYYLSSDWIGYYYPAYVPDGYELVAETVDRFRGKLNFVNGTDELYFYCTYNESVATLDKEKERCEVIQIGDQKGYFILYEELSKASLFFDNCVVSIYFKNISEEEIRKIAKNLKKFL